jgi:hypothetical protein
MEKYEANSGCRADGSWWVSTGRGGRRRTYGTQRAHKTYRTYGTHRTHRAGSASGASRSGHNNMCRVQAESAADAAERGFGGLDHLDHLDHLDLAGHGPPMPQESAMPCHLPIAARAVGWRNLDRQTHAPVSFPFARCCRCCYETFAEPHPSFAAGPLLHCSIAPAFTCSLARPPNPPNPPNPLAHSLTLTHAPAHPLTHQLTHSVTHSLTHSLTHSTAVSASVSVSVLSLLLPSPLSASTPPHSARSPPSSAITSLGACCSHSLPHPRTHRSSCELRAASGPAVCFPRPSPLPATSLFCPVRCL